MLDARIATAISNLCVFRADFIFNGVPKKKGKRNHGKKSQPELQVCRHHMALEESTEKNPYARFLQIQKPLHSIFPFPLHSFSQIQLLRRPIHFLQGVLEFTGKMIFHLLPQRPSRSIDVINEMRSSIFRGRLSFLEGRRKALKLEIRCQRSLR